MMTTDMKGVKLRDELNVNRLTFQQCETPALRTVRAFPNDVHFQLINHRIFEPNEYHFSCTRDCQKSDDPCCCPAARPPCNQDDSSPVKDNIDRLDFILALETVRQETTLDTEDKSISTSHVLRYTCLSLQSNHQ